MFDSYHAMVEKFDHFQLQAIGGSLLRFNPIQQKTPSSMNQIPINKLGQDGRLMIELALPSIPLVDVELASKDSLSAISKKGEAVGR